MRLPQPAALASADGYFRPVSIASSKIGIQRAHDQPMSPAGGDVPEEACGARDRGHEQIQGAAVADGAAGKAAAHGARSPKRLVLQGQIPEPSRALAGEEVCALLELTPEG